MYGAFGAWGWPSGDIASFEAEYNATYLPLVRAVPHVVGLELLQADASGRESDIYRIGLMWFENEEAYAQAAETKEWEAMFACCYSLMERYSVPMRFAYVRSTAS